MMNLVGGNASLGPRAQARLDKLKARHDEVVRHEQAHYDKARHLAASGPVLSDFVTGPDGNQYATGGHVQINTGETGDPFKDLENGKIIVEAAEAPTQVDSELSDADHNVAAKGRAMIAKNQSKVDKLNQLKDRTGGHASQMSQQRLGDIATGMGLDIPPGQILRLIA